MVNVKLCAKIPNHSYFKDSEPESSSEGRKEPPTAGSNAQRICGEVTFAIIQILAPLTQFGVSDHEATLVLLRNSEISETLSHKGSKRRRPSSHGAEKMK